MQGFLNALVYGVSARVVVRYKRLCGCHVSSLDDEEGVRRSSNLAGRSRQGSAPLDAAHYNSYQPLSDGNEHQHLSTPSNYGTSNHKLPGSITAPLNVPGPSTNSDDPIEASPRSYSDQSVFHRSSRGLILGKKREGDNRLPVV